MMSGAFFFHAGAGSLLPSAARSSSIGQQLIARAGFDGSLNVQDDHAWDNDDDFLSPGPAPAWARPLSDARSDSHCGRVGCAWA